MRRWIGARSVVFGGAAIGAGVTVLESVCTGQVYVPTLLLIIRSSSGAAAKAWTCLLLYNLMFIVPLVCVFLLTYFGMKMNLLQELNRRNVVMSKVLLGVFFIALAIAMAVS
jgi:hypothetical protein